MPVAPVRPPAARSRIVRVLLLDVVVVAALATAMIVLAQLARDAVIRSANLSTIEPHTGAMWSLARASWSSLLMVGIGIALLYVALFRRGTLGARTFGRPRRGSVLPLVFLVAAFAAPIGVVAGSAALASRQTVTPPDETPLDVSGDASGAAPVPSATAPPTPSPSAAAAQLRVAGAAPAAAPRPVATAPRTVPATPEKPKLPPTPVPTAKPKATPKASPAPKKQGGGQQQSQ